MEMHPITVALIAFAIVMAAMVFLVLVLEVFRRIGERTARRAAAEAAAAPAGELDGELVAVLTAAAREVLGAPVRLYQVHVHRGGATETWSRAGRMDIMVSHRVEPKR